MLLPVSAAVVAASAAGVAAYGALAPQSQLFGATLAHSEEPRQLALTYDDGPNEPCTLQLLEVLARHNVKGTFFLIGRFARQRPDLTRAIAAAGHSIGNHTFTHPNLIFCSAKKIARELSDCQSALADILGALPKIFRPPFGARRPDVLRIAKETNLAPIMWSVTCYDWKRAATTERVERHAVRQISRRRRYGNILLMHDGSHLGMGADRSHTVEATARLISRYAAAGYSFVTIPQLTA